MTQRNRIGDALDLAATWILSMQAEYGGFPFSSLERGSAGAWPTSQAVSALLSINPAYFPDLEPSLQWLEQSHTEYVWGPMQKGSQLLDSTVWVALAFKRAYECSGNYMKIIKHTVDRMLANRNPDEGWGSWKNDKSRIIVTANVLALLCEVKPLGIYPVSPLSEGCDFLVESQNIDGGWGFRKNERSNALATAYALIALSYLSPQANVVSRGLGWLDAERRSYYSSARSLYRQESVWREDSIQRWSYFLLPAVISAFVYNGKAFEAFRDIRYLLSLQQSSGAWVDPDEPYLAFHTYLTGYFLAQVHQRVDIDQFERYCDVLDQIQEEEQTSILRAHHNKLLRFIIEEALKISEEEFTLASGTKSRYYYDLKRVLLDPESISLIGRIIWEKIKTETADAIGGPESGAIPIAIAVSQESNETRKPLKAFFVRKTPKGHGTQQWIEGTVNRGDRVILVEDVVTTGGSLMKTIDKLRAHDCEIVRVISIVDREGGGGDNVAKLGIQYEPLFTLRDFEGLV